MPPNEAAHGVTSERVAVRAWEHSIVGSTASLCQVIAQHAHADSGERGGTVFASLALAREVGAGGQVDVAPAQADQFGDAQPGLHCDH